MITMAVVVSSDPECPLLSGRDTACALERLSCHQATGSVCQGSRKKNGNVRVQKDLQDLSKTARGLLEEVIFSPFDLFPILNNFLTRLGQGGQHKMVYIVLIDRAVLVSTM